MGVSILNYYISTLEKGVGQIRLLFLHCEGKSAALSLKGLAVGALIHGGIGLMGADLNGVQTAVGLTLAMVRAGSDLAFDGSVGGAGAAAVGMIGHEEIPPCKIRAKRTFRPRAEDSLRRGAKNIHRARTL